MNETSMKMNFKQFTNELKNTPTSLFSNFTDFQNIFTFVQSIS